MYLVEHKYKSGTNQYTYLKLMRSIRVGATITKKVVLNFGNINDKNSKAYWLKNLISKPVIGNIKLYTLPMAIYTICDKYLNLFEILNNIFPSLGIDISLYTVLMIISRIIEPDSKLSLTRRYSRYQLPVTMPSKINVEYLYRTLDHLESKKDEIENRIYNSLTQQGLIDVTIVFYMWPLGYDLTSTYFEGDNCDLAKYGYSRDHRPDRIQIEIGLVIDKNGIPIYHEVFEGNISDRKTYQGVVNNMKKKFKIEKLIFISDKGMLNKDNIEFISSLGYEYIISQSIRNGFKEFESYLKDKDNYVRLQVPSGAQDNLFYRNTSAGVICFNPFTQEKSKRTRDDGIKKNKNI